MNYNKKEQLLDKVNGLKYLDSSEHAFWNNKVVFSACKRIEEFFDELVPEVPQYVADWYEEHKDNLEYDIWEYIFHWGKQQNSEFYEWMNHANNNPFQTLANMNQFGYKIKEEKKYLVRMIGIVESESYLKYNTESKCWYLGNSETYTNNIVKHTMKDLEDSGFKDVFPSPLFEIVEVKE